MTQGKSLAAVFLESSGPARLLMAGIFTSRLALFTVWPFLALILSEQKNASLAEIGFVFSLSAIAGLLVAPAAGILADRINRRSLQVSVGLFASICLLALLIFPSKEAWFITLFLFSLSNGIQEPLLRASLGELAENESRRAALYHLRYYCVNVAAAIGPLAGIWLVNAGREIALMLAALSFAFLALAIRLAVAPPRRDIAQEVSRPGIGQTISALSRHAAFRGLFFCNLILVFIYALTDEPLNFHLIDLEVPGIVALIAALSFVNSVTVLAIHGIFMSRILALRETHALAIALAALCVSLSLIACNFSQIKWLWLLAIAIATLGEIIAMPLFLTVLDRIAPSSDRNAWFGIYMLSNGGGAFAPALAAVVISTLGGPALFLMGAALCLPLCWLGIRALGHLATHPQPKDAAA